MSRKLLEQKEWEYYLYEDNDTIELSVPIARPNPGFDVIHILDGTEKEKYLQTGITALENRIADMKVNFYDYKMNSWR